MHDNLRMRRIKWELVKAGIGPFGLRTNEVKYLPKLIRDDEHIVVAINGWHDSGLAMLIGTDKRIIFLNRKLFHSLEQEIMLEGVNGITHDNQGFFATVVLHTRIAEYKFRYVSIASAQRFVEYIEKTAILKKDENK